jgi:membrane peptidoglycan carboxypeptidase
MLIWGGSATGLTYSESVLGSSVITKGSVVGRLVTMSAVGGVLAAAIMLPVVGSIGLAVKSGATKFDDLSTSALGQVPQRSELTDSNGHVLAYFYSVDSSYYYKPGDVKPVSVQGIDRDPVPFNQISPNMDKAIIAIEDSRYYEHGAIDFRGTLRAIVNDLEHKPVQGGSTIAQQYVKNVLILTAPNPVAEENATSETLSRKIHELRLAIQIEHKMSRDDILAGYLNDAYFGYPVVGVQVAAQTFFGTTAAKLTLPEAAVLAGMVENPSQYNPLLNPKDSLARRNTVLYRMAQLGMISWKTARATYNQPLGLHPTTLQNGCTSTSAKYAAFFCDYALQSLLRDPQLGKTPQDRAHLLVTGGLKITTTLNPADQNAANHAVSYVVPATGGLNPGHLADSEALIQPGTGRIRAIAEDRSYGVGPGKTTIDYAATAPFDGSTLGVQTGSSSKLFTLVTALEQGVPFGFTQTVQYSETVQPYYSCNGTPTSPYQLSNASTGDHGTYSLYTGTTSSINTYFAQLEKKVGLCNVVQTAANLGMTWGDGVSLLKPSEGQLSADNYPTFTLGSITVAPLSMADAYATVAARGKYCAPVALEKIVTDAGKSLPVPSAHCHQAIPQTVADAANYILQGVLTAPGATADNRGIGRPAAAKTGTAGSANTSPPSAAFGGYTPTLAGYVWVGGPTRTVYMGGYPYGCYRDNLSGYACVGSMFGDDAPGATWQMTFEHAQLGPPLSFVPVPPDSPLFSLGNGQSVKQPSPKKQGGPNPTPTTGGGGGHTHCPKFFPLCPGGLSPSPPAVPTPTQSVIPTPTTSSGSPPG